MFSLCMTCMTSLEKDTHSFQLFYKRLLFYEKGLKKEYHDLHDCTDSFPRCHCMLFFGAFEDRETHTNRVQVIFFPQNQSRSFNDAPVLKGLCHSSPVHFV